jgi:hypothetical protein
MEEGLTNWARLVRRKDFECTVSQQPHSCHTALLEGAMWKTHITKAYRNESVEEAVDGVIYILDNSRVSDSKLGSQASISSKCDTKLSFTVDRMKYSSSRLTPVLNCNTSSLSIHNRIMVGTTQHSGTTTQ